VRNVPAESLIKKPNAPLESVPKGMLRVRTIRHAACIESGHDKFDETVSKFLGVVGEQNLVGMHPINYEHFDVQVQKIMTDYGLIIIYRA